MRGRTITPAKIERAKEMRAQGIGWRAIGRELGHPYSSLQYWVTGKNSVGINGGVWTNEEVERARKLREDGMTWPQIAEAMGRTPGACRNRIRYPHRNDKQRARDRETYVWYSHKIVKVVVPERVLAERDRIYSLPPNPIAELLGEPPPGRSALDRR